MQIQEILAIHNSFAAGNSNRDILGDAYLMLNNPIYKNIKDLSLQIGCQYKEAWSEYLVMPFNALGEIIVDKKIPYVPCARLLQKIEDQRANVLSIADLAVPESHHLHEAAHVIAEYYFKEALLNTPQEKILKSIFCESFANTIDALVWLSVADDVHGFFLQHNSYMKPNPKDLALMARLNKAMGSQFIFIYTLVAYMHANFLIETISPKLIEELAARYAPEVKLNEKLIKDCEELMKMAEKLDPLFRVQTTQMYLKLEGFDGEIYELLNFPFMKVFNANPIFSQCQALFLEAALQGKVIANG